MEPSVVNTPDVTPQDPQVETPVVPETPTDPAPTPAPGSHTDPQLLLKSLKEEREKRRELEEELNRRSQTPPASEDIFSDEGKAIIEKYVSPLTQQVSHLTEQLAMKDLLTQFPQLKDKAPEFDEFRKSRGNYSLEDAAKLFMADHGLAEPPKRKGLEKPSGGNRTPAPQGMTKDDIENLRKTDAKKYAKLLKEGKIDPSQL